MSISLSTISKFRIELEADFRLARNLFSIGFDEVGVLIAGRGLEGVLRKVAAMRKIELVVRGNATSVAEADLMT